MQSRRARFFPEDQIQLIAIEARVFHDLADLQNRTAISGGPKLRKKLASLIVPNPRRSLASGNINLRGFAHFARSLSELGNSVPGELHVIEGRLNGF